MNILKCTQLIFIIIFFCQTVNFNNFNNKNEEIYFNVYKSI